MLAHYGGLDMQKLLAMPLATFWMLHRNIDRLAAEKDLRKAEAAIRIQSAEGVRALFGDLRKQMGTVVSFDEVLTRQAEKFDKAGLNSLRSLGKVNR